jgi:hypothetical protein
MMYATDNTANQLAKAVGKCKKFFFPCFPFTLCPCLMHFFCFVLWVSTSADKQLLIGALCGYSAWGSGGLSGAGLFAVRDIIWGTFYCSNFCTKWKGVQPSYCFMIVTNHCHVRLCVCVC